MADANPMTTVAPTTAGKGQLLTGPQQADLTAAVAAMLWQQASGETASFPLELAEVGAVSVAGAFVSLKRGRHLRGCCGMLGRPVSLRDALLHAVERTIWEDERFPPVSATELDFLDVEVWLLGNLQPVEARGDARADSIVLGTHGIQIVRGPARGLFLPSVPIEFKWDVSTYLDRVCLKAGLPATRLEGRRRRPVHLRRRCAPQTRLPASNRPPVGRQSRRTPARLPTCRA